MGDDIKRASHEATDVNGITIEVDYGAEFQRLSRTLRQTIEEFRVQKKMAENPTAAAMETIRDAEEKELYRLVSSKANEIRIIYVDGRVFSADYTQQEPALSEASEEDGREISIVPGADSPGCLLLARASRDISGAVIGGIIRGLAVQSQIDVVPEL